MKRFLMLTMLFSRFGWAQDGYQAGVTLSPDERFLASGSCRNQLDLFRVSDGKRIRTFRSDQRFLTKPAFSPDGKLITAGNLDPDGGVNPVWEVATGKLVARLAVWSDVDSPEAMHTLGFTGDGAYVLGALSTGGQAVAFRRSDWKIAFLKSRGSETYPLSAVRPIGSLLISLPSELGGYDLWDPLAGYRSPWGTWPIDRPRGVSYLAFSGDGHVLALAGDGWTAAVDHRTMPKSGELVPYSPRKTEVIKDFVVRSLCASRTGSAVYIGSRDGRIAQFDLKTGKLVKSWKAFKMPVKGLAINRKGDRLYSYNLDKVRVWNTASGKLVREF